VESFLWDAALNPLSNKQTIKVNRSAVDGRFVTEKYADKHPKTTETERYHVKKGK